MARIAVSALLVLAGCATAPPPALQAPPDSLPATAWTSVKVALVVRLVARPGQEEALAGFLAAAAPLAQAESFTQAWFALRAAPAVFYIVDAFANDADRQKHLTGEIADALRAKAGALLAEAPSIEKANILGAKL